MAGLLILLGGLMTIVTLERQTARAHVDAYRADLAARSALAEVLPAVYGYVIGAGLAPAGHPFVRYVEMSPAFVSIEAGVPLTAAPAEPAPADTKIRTGELAAGPAAVTVHKGPYEGLGDAYAAIERWVESSDASLAGAPWELYLTDPGEVPDPSDWLTKVCWPVTGVS